VNEWRGRSPLSALAVGKVRKEKSQTTNAKQSSGEILQALHSIRTEPKSEFFLRVRVCREKIAMPARAAQTSE